MSNNLMYIATSGLNAAMWGITTTGQNIANSATPGYSVERPVYAETSGQYTSSGYLPAGVTTTTVQRQYNQYLANQLNSAQTQGGALTTYYNLVSQLNNYIGNPTTGISTAITSYFTGMQSVANNPSDPATRQTALSNAQVLANQITAAGQQYDALRQSVNTQLSNTVTQINSYTSQIAQLNQQISAASAQGQPPNQLMDKRDLALSNLSQLTGVQMVQNSDGYSVFMSNGQPLVVAGQSYQLAAVTSPSDPTELTIASQGVAGANPPGQTTYLPESSLTGGTLGGLLSFRNQTLDPAEAQLGAIATSFASQVNAQNSLGLDLSGNAGGALFKVGAPVVYANQANTSSATLSVSIMNGSQPTTSDYTLAINNGNYTLTDRATGNVIGAQPVGSTMPITIGNLQLNVNGTMNAGDSFTVQPTRGALNGFGVATTNYSAIAAASPVLAQKVSTNTGTGTITQGSVSAGYQIPAGGVTLSYNGTTTPPSVSGFPNGSVVTVNTAPPQSFNIGTGPGQVQSVPYSALQGNAMTITGTGGLNAVTVTMAGAPANGDTFTIGKNTNGASDPRNAQALAALVSAKTLNNGTLTLTGAYSSYVNTIGNAASQLQASSSAQTGLVGQITSAMQAVSSVNTNEEAANLMQYQQLYQANAKVIQTASTLFQTVLGLFN
ncbi:flagellar hook-associated protein FlgK [Burkholderia sp. FERM BP-3421]|uniref:flagellar hook-associated protein FlgK n=1 Tax=Burkholderia sp. FERM BP-3421 TaxID=1494466 RepID=UPI00235ECC2D|nr:flagellar hook-associated protein FlgK [Burkholderia sp. FERM BP-3421]WDD95600.1 flagellar hook-associated protein FlgK [Burkholderia sp. FERM BP-3421]